MRHPARWVASLGLIGALVAIALIAAAQQAHRGTGVAPGIVSHAGSEPVPLSQTAAHDYNPFGTGPENRAQVNNVVDSIPSTTWSTEQYYNGTLKKPGGIGAGLFLDASPGVVAKAIEIQTPTPGFSVQIYTANAVRLSLAYGDSMTLAERGWQGPFGHSDYVHGRERVTIELSGHRFRYYLIWITTLPPHMQSASIAELTLFK
jgi:serine/threonine-protein kinase